jgi:hypothetical protein
MYIRLHVKYLLLLSDINEIEFSWKVFEKYSHAEVDKIRPERAELFHTGRRTDINDDANSRSSQFSERSKKSVWNSSHLNSKHADVTH